MVKLKVSPLSQIQMYFYDNEQSITFLKIRNETLHISPVVCTQPVQAKPNSFDSGSVGCET